MAQVINPQTRYFCHRCGREVKPTPDFLCPHCHTGFIEELVTQSALPETHQNEAPVNLFSSSGVHNQGGSGNIFHFLQGLLSSAMPPASTPVHGAASAQPGTNTTGVRQASGNLAGASNSPITYFRYTNYPPQRTPNDPPYQPGAAFDLEGLLEQILDWVGTENAVFRMDPGGLVTYVEYGPSGSSTRHTSSGPFGRNMRDYAWGPGSLEQIMEQLFNQIEGHGIPPSNQETIEKLPTVVIDDDDIKRETQCSVCMEYFKIKEKVIALPCEHLFHKDCILPWLNLHGTCPICRKAVGPESQTEENRYYTPGSAGNRTRPGPIRPPPVNTNPPNTTSSGLISPPPPPSAPAFHRSYSYNYPNVVPGVASSGAHAPARDPNAPTQHFRFHYYPQQPQPPPNLSGYPRPPPLTRAPIATLIRTPIPPPPQNYRCSPPSFHRSFSMNPTAFDYYNESHPGQQSSNRYSHPPSNNNRPPPRDEQPLPPSPFNRSPPQGPPPLSNYHNPVNQPLGAPSSSTSHNFSSRPHGITPEGDNIIRGKDTTPAQDNDNNNDNSNNANTNIRPSSNTNNRNGNHSTAINLNNNSFTSPISNSPLISHNNNSLSNIASSSLSHIPQNVAQSNPTASKREFSDDRAHKIIYEENQNLKTNNINKNLSTSRLPSPPRPGNMGKKSKLADFDCD